MRAWTSITYVFFEPKPEIDTTDGVAYIFKCANPGCGSTICRSTTTKDAGSTSNLARHAIKCWGEEVYNETRAQADAKAARKALVKYKRTGSLEMAFQTPAKGAKTVVRYQNRPLTCEETR